MAEHAESCNKTVGPFAAQAVEAWLRTHCDSEDDAIITREDLRAAFRIKTPEEQSEFLEYLAREARRRGAVVTLPSIRRDRSARDLGRH